MASTYAGDIFELDSVQGGSGDVITLFIPASSAAQFRTTSNHKAYFEPVTRPPGANQHGFFAYVAGFSRVDDKTAKVTVPRMDTNPLRGMVPGVYRILIVTALDWAGSRDLFTAIQRPGSQPPVLGGSGLSLMRAGGAPLLASPLLSGAVPSPYLGPSIRLAPGTNVAVGLPPRQAGAPTAPPLQALDPSRAAAARFALDSARPVTQTSSGFLFTAGTAGAMSEAEPMEAEASVRFLVELMTPVRQAPGPELVSVNHRPDIVSGPHPVELRSGGSPPVGHVLYLVGMEFMDGSGEPIVDNPVHVQLDERSALPGDDSRIVAVSADREALHKRLREGMLEPGPAGDTTDREGKLYCLIRAKLFDEDELSDASQSLLAFKVTLGVPGEELESAGSGAGGLGTVPRPVMLVGATGLPTLATTDSDEGALGFFRDLIDILVNPGTPAVTQSLIVVAKGVAEAHAAVTRSTQRATGFLLERIADHFIGRFPLAPQYLQQKDIDDVARALVIGLLLGVPRGIWVMGRDQVEDLKALVFDLPRALFNFISEDPRFALQVAGSLADRRVGLVLYALDKSFQAKIDGAIARYKGLAAKMGKLLSGLYEAVVKDPTSFTLALGKAFYNDFEEFVGHIATDYLRYPKSSNPYHCFVGAFIGGDLLGYVLATVGVEVLFAYLSAGIATYLKAIAKVATVAKLLKRIAPLIDALNRLRNVVSELSASARLALKEGVTRSVLAAMRLLSHLNPRFVSSFLKVLTEGGKATRSRSLRWLFRYGTEADGSRMQAVAESLTRHVPEGKEARAEGVFEFLAGLAEPDSAARHESYVPNCLRGAK